MRLVQIALVVQVAVLCRAEKPSASGDKALIMLEIEPVGEERTKRSSEQDALRYIRQSAALPPEYLGLLQQLSAQQQSAAGSPQQQQLIQELVVAREGAQHAPAAARYVLSPDGRLLDQSLAQPAPQSAPQPGRPLLSPELEAFSRLQTQLQQDYHDAPIRAQIAGLTTRPTAPLAPQPPTPVGPDSQAPQVFSQAPSQAATRHQERLRAQLQGQDPQLIYGGLPEFDAQAALQQQLAQLAAAGQSEQQLAALYSQPQLRPAPQPVVYQQPQPQPQPQLRPAAPQPIVYQPQPQPQKLIYQQPLPAPQQVRRPSALAPSAQAQLLPQNIAQQPQYLVETSRSPRPSPQPSAVPQYVPEASAAPQLQYLDLLRSQQAAPSPQAAAPEPQPESYVQTLLQPSAGRGLFTPLKQPSRSSIFVSRSSTLKPEEESAPQKLPVVRLPSPAGQRPLTRSELDALVGAGFTVTPVQGDETQGFLKAKRQQPKQEEKKNHVVYQNHQDGVSYQYSPGGGAGKAAKQSLGLGGDKRPHLRNLYRLETDRSDQQLVTYVLALGAAPSA